MLKGFELGFDIADIQEVQVIRGTLDAVNQLLAESNWSLLDVYYTRDGIVCCVVVRIKDNG